MAKITGLDTFDVRFPTSWNSDGSDAMNPDPNYSAAYVVVRTNDATGLAGYGLVFTIGRGNDIQAAAIGALSHLIVGRDVDDVIGDLGAFARTLTDDSQLRWLGPEKGVIHMAVGGVINAVWDMAARRVGKPVWRLIADMAPEQIVELVDFRYLTDALTRDEALQILRDGLPHKSSRIAQLLNDGYPAYTTSPGWLGYPDDRLERLAREAMTSGFRTIKLKVGRSLDEDVRRCRIAREAIGADAGLAIDANQRWDVPVAINWLRSLAPFQIAWVEEPTSPDDVLAHAAIRRGVAPMAVSTGEHTQNRVIFKQLFQAHAVDLIQIDATRVAGVNENLAILLMAAKFGVRVFPHGGGVGLCELVQHLAMADFVAISGRKEDRAIEFVDHLHEHFINPVEIRRGRYRAPSARGFSAQMHQQSIDDYLFPGGRVWSR